MTERQRTAAQAVCAVLVVIVDVIAWRWWLAHTWR